MRSDDRELGRDSLAGRLDLLLALRGGGRLQTCDGLVECPPELAEGK